MKIHTLDLDFMGEKKAIAAFLIEHQGELVLIETGPYSTFTNLEKRLNKIGYALHEIKHVFLTHIHLDHAGAAWAFAKKGATIYVHPAGKRHLIDPSKLMASAKMIYLDEMEKLWGTMEPIDEAQIFTPAHGENIELENLQITAWHTPGHAVHHIAWQVDKNLFTGDVAGVKINIGPVVPPCPPPDINVEDWLASINLMRKLDVETLFLTHFGQIFQKNDHLDELEKRLVAWADWMKPHFEQQNLQTEVVPLFERFFKKELRENGVNSAGLKKYEAANPPFMTVAGLLRYWSKRTF